MPAEREPRTTAPAEPQTPKVPEIRPAGKRIETAEPHRARSQTPVEAATACQEKETAATARNTAPTTETAARRWGMRIRREKRIARRWGPAREAAESPERRSKTILAEPRESTASAARAEPAGPNQPRTASKMLPRESPARRLWRPLDSLRDSTAVAHVVGLQIFCSC